MGMWILRGEQTFYKSGGRLFDGVKKRVEYNSDTFEPILTKLPNQLEDTESESRFEGRTVILGATREELQSMTIQQIYKEFGIKPRKGFTKEVLIEEILGAVE